MLNPKLALEAALPNWTGWKTAKLALVALGATAGVLAMGPGLSDEVWLTV